MFYRELSAQNELRPQDVMRILVHYHAYGDAAKVPALVDGHSGRIRKQIELREEDKTLGASLTSMRASGSKVSTYRGMFRLNSFSSISSRPTTRACFDRNDVDKVGAELIALYGNPDELLNWRLIMAPGFVTQYLIAHEAVHLAVADHSNRFWLTLKSLCPESDRARHWLRAHETEMMMDLNAIVRDTETDTRTSRA